jgi:UPF0506
MVRFTCLIALALLKPLPLVSGICTTEYDPVYCTLQGSMFSNRCNAVGAGYDPADCTDPAFGAACPTTASSQIVCAGTLYDNICLASQAGFVPSTECTLPTKAPTAVRTRQSTRAPTPAPAPLCREETLTCAIATRSKPCCTGLVCRLKSGSSTARACQTCLANASLCRENRDCCSKKCQTVSGKLRCKA